jgi:hypothetical protein
MRGGATLRKRKHSSDDIWQKNKPGRLRVIRFFKKTGFFHQGVILKVFNESNLI